MRPIVNMPEEERSHGHRQHAQNFVKDRACDSRDILTDRQTHRQTHSSQYFATAAAVEVIIQYTFQKNRRNPIYLNIMSNTEKTHFVMYAIYKNFKQTK